MLYLGPLDYLVQNFANRNSLPMKNFFLTNLFRLKLITAHKHVINTKKEFICSAKICAASETAVIRESEKAESIEIQASTVQNADKKGKKRLVRRCDLKPTQHESLVGVKKKEN